jgi:hypothetical protein
VAIEIRQANSQTAKSNNMLIEEESSIQFCMFSLQTHLHGDFESLYKEVPKILLTQVTEERPVRWKF